MYYGALPGLFMSCILILMAVTLQLSFASSEHPIGVNQWLPPGGGTQ